MHRRPIGLRETKRGKEKDEKSETEWINRRLKKIVLKNNGLGN